MGSRLPNGRLSEKGGVAGDPGGIAEMDDATEVLVHGMGRFIIEFGDRLDGHY